MAQITYADKVKIDDNPSLPAVNKVRDVDMNEIKEVVNENDDTLQNLVADVLYSSSSGATGNLTLSSSVANYKYIEISGLNSDGTIYPSQKFFTNNSSNFDIQYNTTYNVSGGVYPSGARYNFNGTSVTVGYYYRVLVAEGTAISYSSSTNNVKITRILGYK